MQLLYLPVLLCISYVTVSHILYCECQFISHINARGIKGNLTFTYRKDNTNASILVIEALIESDSSSLFGKERNVIKSDDDIEKSQRIKFDWSIHQNTLQPHMLYACSNEDLGTEILKTSFSKNRPIVLGQLNQWSIALDGVLQTHSLPSLSALIWGKSVQVRLSNIYNEHSQTHPPATAPGGLTKPILSSSVAISAGKPTFAPRPKPTISAKLKPPSPPLLPKPEALVSETNTASLLNVTSSLDSIFSNSSQSSLSSKDELAAEFNRRVLKLYGKSIVCGNIIDTRSVKSAEAIFESQIAGKISIRGNEDDTTLIMSNLYHVKSKVTTRHDWKILASDILDNRRHEEQCKYLQLLFDPNNIDDIKCKTNDTVNCKMGDLTKKHGQVQVSGLGKSNRLNLVDLNLPLSALEGSRTLFLVIYEVKAPRKQINEDAIPERANILTCAQIKSVNSRKLEASFNMDGVRGSITMLQRHFTEPTKIFYDLFGLEGNIKYQSIKELPLPSRSSSDNSKLCGNLGDVFNPNKVQSQPDQSVHKLITVDMYPVGNLSAKHGPMSVIDSEYEDHYMGEYIDPSIQLFGLQTVAGRSLAINKNNGENWVCATLDYVDEAINLASSTFYYPVVGKIYFQQLANDPHSGTSVLVEVYNPNSERDSEGHNWMIHLKPAMADFYNWSQRCQSSGEIYDPLQASTGLTGEAYNRQCSTSLLNEPLRCRAGDTSLKSGFKVSLPVSHLNRTRLYYVDPFLPLDGPNSIIAKSVVIYDESSPVQRGNRLACSTIRVVHPLKAAIKTWSSGPSIPSAVFGSMTFEQDSSSHPTRIKTELSGFNGNVENYAIHSVWTMDDREFPCSNDSLYDIYDPYDNENSLRLPPSAHYGSLATVDRVKVGDMSRKHGTFEGLSGIQKTYVDANAPLFAPRSIIGRSIVLRAAVNDFRWVCGNIELEYDKGSTREIIGLASFDDPRSKIAGYVRFTQLEFKDGSLSDTFIQVDLKLRDDGVHELETSGAHNWAIFVNQVGADAFIPADEVRCIAAGFKWNPYQAQDHLETYSSSCTSTEQLACAMGDLGARHGTLVLGPNNRRAISDSNLPLVGNYSIMGRSLIIFDNKRPSVKIACANIFPDIHLKSNVVIKRMPSFTVARFVEQMRSLLDAAEWLMVPELKVTKSVANGECVQMTIHFYGQKAHQMQVELNNLIALGTVRRSTRVGVETISTHYKLCRVGEMQLTSSASQVSSNLQLSMVVLFTLLLQVVVSFLRNSKLE